MGLQKTELKRWKRWLKRSAKCSPTLSAFQLFFYLLPRVEATLGWNWRTSSAFCPSNAFGVLSLERKLNQYLFTPPRLRARCTEIRWLRCGAGIYHRAVRRVFSESM